MTVVAPLQVEKRAARAAMRRTLAALSDDARLEAGVRVAGHLAPLLDALATRAPGATVALFASLPIELSTSAVDEALLARGLGRALPTMVDGELRFHLAPDTPICDLPRDSYGIPTPPTDAPGIALADCGLVLVPGLAFDDEGRRLGHGKGYYDRALRRARAQRSPPLAIALLLDLQRQARVPAGPDDERVDGLCAPELGLRLLSSATPPSVTPPR